MTAHSALSDKSKDKKSADADKSTENVTEDKLPDEAKEGPTLTLAGLQFFVADINNKILLWQEVGSQTFNSEVRGLRSASSQDALRLLRAEDRKNVLRLIQGAIKNGKSGPYDIGGSPDHRIPGVPFMAYRYEASGQAFALCFPSVGESHSGGQVALGLAPILKHFVANSNRVVFLVDNFGYVRYASEGFLQNFGIMDAKLILGRNVAHIQQRIGRSLTTLVLESLVRRASGTGRAKFILASNERLEMNYQIMYFMISGSFGGVLFSGGLVSGDANYGRVFEICSAPMLVVNTKDRMIVAANKAAMKAYHLTRQAMTDHTITETLLHPKSYAMLLKAGEDKSETPVSVSVNSLNGQTKKKRLKVTLMEADVDEDAPKLLLESRS